MTLIVVLALTAFQMTKVEAGTWYSTYRGPCAQSIDGAWYRSPTRATIGAYVESCSYFGEGLVLETSTGSHSARASGWALEHDFPETTAATKCRYSLLKQGAANDITCRTTHNR